MRGAEVVNPNALGFFPLPALPPAPAPASLRDEPAPVAAKDAIGAPIPAGSKRTPSLPPQRDRPPNGYGAAQGRPMICAFSCH